ncbi:DNA repair protein RecO [Endozoicomonas sp. (ex Bugula neritina AB1)]|nr:DNA repair protein RecO [Endozoicomonas sp. (ex Bugula neritina AB1)]
MELQRAWMLHSRPYKEQSVIAEFLVENHGRVAMVVRGVRKARSSHAALLQPFNSLLISWKGRSELKTLVNLEPLTNTRLLGNALYCGFYINELLLRAMIQGQELEGVTELYEDVVARLATAHTPLEPLLRSFELALLDLAGYLPELDVDAATGLPLSPDAVYRFQQETGLLPIVPPVSEDLRASCFPAELLLALSSRDFSRSEFYAGFKRFTRMALKPLLGHYPLQSRLLFQTRRKTPES